MFKAEHRTLEDDDEIVTLPYYGGANGNVLQIRHKPDGTVITEIITKSKSPDQMNANEGGTFMTNLNTIQQAAAVLVNLQQRVKQNGRLTVNDQKLYAENLELLGVAAQHLAHLQMEGGNSEDFRLLLGSAEKKLPDRFPPYKPPAIKEEPDNEGDAIENHKTDKDEDSITVSADSESSVAEAKPVGLAIAGVGGVASSKPAATAVVGPGGLAVARPIATAIAGVSPSQVAGLGIPIPQKLKGTTKSVSQISFPLPGKKYGLVDLSMEDGLGLLVGPEYDPESRLSDKGISAEVVNGNNQAKKDDIKKTIENINTKKENDNDDEIVALDEDEEPTQEKLDLAVAPHRMHPNQYPLIPPRFRPVLATNYGWNPEAYLGYNPYSPIPVDQLDRSYNAEPYYPTMQFYNPFQYYSY